MREAEYFCPRHWTKPCLICLASDATGSSFRQRDLHHGITLPGFSFSRASPSPPRTSSAGAAAMNAIAAPKSSTQNRLEGFALTAILQGFPSFAAAALLLKLARHDIAGGVVLFVVLTSVLPRPVHALARAEISKVLQAWLRAAVLQRRPVVFGKDREVARAADDVGATGDERADAGAAGGGRDEYEVIFRAVISAADLPEWRSVC